MQGVIEWWCHPIGITSEPAINVAVGVVGALTLGGPQMRARNRR